MAGIMLFPAVFDVVKRAAQGFLYIPADSITICGAIVIAASLLPWVRLAAWIQLMCFTLSSVDVIYFQIQRLKQNISLVPGAALIIVPVMLFGAWNATRLCCKSESAPP